VAMSVSSWLTVYLCWS